MIKSTPSKTTKKPKKKTVRAQALPAAPRDLARQLAETLLRSLEREMKSKGTKEEKQERLFGSKGVLAQLPKLMQLLVQLEDTETVIEADAPLSDEDLALLKEWLAQRAR